MRRWRLALPFIWMAVIWFLSSLPSAHEGELAGIEIPELLQNSAHAVVYGLLAAAWMVAVGADAITPLRVVLYCTTYGVIDELHQRFVPGRTSSILDVAVDLLGALCVAYIARRYLLSRQRLTAADLT